MEEFREFIERYIDINDSDWQKVSAHFRRLKLPANYNVLEDGKICRKLYFVEKGLLRFFTIKNGEEKTKFFTIAPYCFTSQASFNSKTPSSEYIQTLEDSVIWETTYEENEALLKLLSWNRFARKITQEVQFYTEEILEDLQSNTAEERYRRMLINQSEILRRVPLKHVASYLGIAPQSLSRIRKKILEDLRS